MPTQPPQSSKSATLQLPEAQAIHSVMEQWRNVHVILAVSGGADSMALLRLALAAKCTSDGAGRLFVGHVDHSLRPGESAADRTWLTGQCKSLGVPLIVRQADVGQLAASQGDGLEAAARTARYQILTEMAEQTGARIVATGHTADDQVETVLFRLLRGSGLRGLAGMRQHRALTKSVTLTRPLLQSWRIDLLNFLQRIDQSFREDSSNDNRQFTRNRIRHDLLPYLRKDFNPEINAALLRLLEQAADSHQVIEMAARELLALCSLKFVDAEAPHAPGPKPGAEKCLLAFNTAPLCKETEPLVREALRLAWQDAGLPEQGMSYTWWRQLAQLARSPSPGSMLNMPGNIRAWCDGTKIVLFG
jgi:tRNA(Ile)-lysidine synthase